MSQEVGRPFDNVLMISVLFRVLLRHFDKDVALDTIGGHDRCCDNCRRKLVYCGRSYK